MKKFDIPRYSMYNIHRVSRYCYREVAPVVTKYPALAEAAMGDPAESARALDRQFSTFRLWRGAQAVCCLFLLTFLVKLC